MNNFIVPTNVNYNFSILEQNLILLNRKFPFLNIQTISKSILGNNLYVIKLGNGKKSVFYSGSIHANEWICSVILMKFIEDYCLAFINSSSLAAFSAYPALHKACMYLMFAWTYSRLISLPTLAAHSPRLNR